MNITKGGQEGSSEYSDLMNYTENSPSTEIIFRWDGSRTWLINRIEAKNRIESLFIKHKELGYGDIIEKSGLDLEIVIEICAELEKEGKIKTVFKNKL